MKVEKNMIQEDEYIDIINYLSKLWYSKITILKLVLIFGIVGVFVALSKPNEYTASSMFIPNYGAQTGGSGGLKSLASLAGINLGSVVDSRNKISPMLYGKILESVTFKKKLLDSPLKNLGDVKTVREYYEKDSKVSSFSILGTLKGYTIGLPAKIIRLFKGVSTEGSTDLISGVEFVSEADILYYEAIDQMLILDINDREGYIEMISVSENPHLSAQVAKNAELILQNQIIEVQTKSSLELLSYLKEQYAEKTTLLNKTQDRYSNFKDQNLNISSNSFKNIEMRLQTELSTKTAVYQNIVTQLEQVKLQVTKDTPVFSILKPVVFPNKRSSPNRVLILLGWLSMGFIFSTGYVLIKESVRDLFKKIKINYSSI